jgi:hypothetical protein
MSWMSRHKNWIRLLVFVLVLIAVLGPWGYEGDGVPPPEFCDPPYLLLRTVTVDGCRAPTSFYPCFRRH